MLTPGCCQHGMTVQPGEMEDENGNKIVLLYLMSTSLLDG